MMSRSGAFSVVGAEVARPPRANVVELDRVRDPPGLGGVGLAVAVYGDLGISGHGARLYQNYMSRESALAGKRSPRRRTGRQARLDRVRRIPDPLAPGPGIQPRPRQARRFEREQVLAGRDARATHRDQCLRGATAQRLAPAPAQLRRPEQRAVRIVVVRERVVSPTRAVTPHPLDPLI